MELTINNKEYKTMTIKIDNKNVGEVLVSGSWTIDAKVKAMAGTDEQKAVTLKFNFVDTPLESIIQSSLKDKRINWQVTARAKFEQVKSGSVVEINYGNQAKATVDPEVAMQSRLAAMTPEARAKWFEEQMAKFK
jgi:hypothetical protein